MYNNLIKIFIMNFLKIMHQEKNGEKLGFIVGFFWVWHHEHL
jgi:hypothetical protein